MLLCFFIVVDVVVIVVDVVVGVVGVVIVVVLIVNGLGYREVVVLCCWRGWVLSIVVAVSRKGMAVIVVYN